MKKKALCLAISLSLFLPQSSFADEPAQAQETTVVQTPQVVGQAAYQGKTSAAAMAWAVVGISFLVVIGVVIAVTLAQDNH